jgi:hypothetical protein
LLLLPAFLPIIIGEFSRHRRSTIMRLMSFAIVLLLHALFVINQPAIDAPDWFTFLE